MAAEAFPLGPALHPRIHPLLALYYYSYISAAKIVWHRLDGIGSEGEDAPCWSSTTLRRFEFQPAGRAEVF